MFNIFDSGRIISKSEFLEKYNNPEEPASKMRELLHRYPSPECDSKCDKNCTGGCTLYWIKFNPSKEIALQT